MIVGVIGSGAIGPDLAYGFLSAIARDPSSKVILVDIKKEALEAGAARIAGYLEKGVARGKISRAAAKATQAALVTTTDLGALENASYVLEAASEDLAVKQRILENLERIVRPDCLIGFATSGLPRKQIAAKAKHEGRCFVNHPFYPAWRSLPIEVVPSSDAAATARMMALLTELGRVPVLTADVECFAADDVFCNYIAEAARIVEEGLATPAQVDAIVNAAIGGGGPFNVMDLTKGNLLVHKCQLLMQKAPTGSAWFAPPAILERQGDKPWHDRKNPAPAGAKLTADVERAILDRVLAVIFSRTYFVVEQKVCEPTEANWLLRMALGFRKGTLDLAAEYGLARVRELCTRYADKNPGFYLPEACKKDALPTFYRNLTIQRDGDVAVVRIFRPEVKNALSKATLEEVDKAVTALVADNAVRGIVLSSEGGSLAGADIQELAVLPDADACRATCLASHPIFERIANAKKPVIAAVDGPVLGGGAELSMACHARVVGKGLALGQPEVNLGIIPGYGGTQRLPRLIGLERAADLLRTGRSVGAAEACAWGWAHGEPVADPVATAKSLIREGVKLTPLDPNPLAATVEIKAADIGHRSLAIDAILVDVLRRGLARPLAEGLAIEADGFARCRGTVDMDIGMKNFIQNGPRVPAAFLHE